MHRAAITPAAPGTSRITRRIAAISCVTVSCEATASARIVESTARRRRPARIPVAPMTLRTASLTRCGRPDRATRLRQTTSEVGWIPGSSRLSPHASFHRRSNRTASAVSRSENPCSACSVMTAAIRVAGSLGRPKSANRSAQSASGNTSPR